jgi:hypothetical protein
VKRGAVMAVIALCFLLAACPAVDTVFSIIDVAIQATANIEIAVGNISPGDAAALTVIVNDASTGLSQLETLYNTYEESCQQSGCNASYLTEAQEWAQTVQATINGDLNALHIKNAATVQQVTAWVALVDDAIAAVVQLVPAVQVETQQPAVAVKPTGIATASSLKTRWDNQICHGAAKCKALVQVNKIRKATIATSPANPASEAFVPAQQTPNASKPVKLASVTPPPIPGMCAQRCTWNAGAPAANQCWSYMGTAPAGTQGEVIGYSTQTGCYIWTYDGSQP